ncbi:MAG: glycoside hydrolase family 127 protein, partial [Clostridia bacterium]|nr:glycoside hydrolase family 127 protein [Clostridia bacterium]
MENEYIAASAKYTAEWDRYFKIAANQQMKDGELWKLLIRQFFNKTDDCDDGWRGEFWGKLMRGGALVYAYLRDAELYEALKAAVLGLLATQEENGRISAYSKEKEFHGWDVWARKYVMLGLEYFYEICNEESLKTQIIDALEKHAHYIMAHIGDGEGKITLLETSAAWGAINSQSIIQPFVKLYKLTNKADYLSYADYLISCGEGENGLFTLAKENKISPFEYPITKAYEMISCFEGILEYYEVDGKTERLNLCQSFADRILQTDFCITPQNPSIGPLSMQRATRDILCVIPAFIMRCLKSLL